MQPLEAPVAIHYCWKEEKSNVGLDLFQLSDKPEAILQRRQNKGFETSCWKRETRNEIVVSREKRGREMSDT